MDVVVDKIDNGLSYLDSLLPGDYYKRTAFLIIRDGWDPKEFVFSSMPFEFYKATWADSFNLRHAVSGHLRKILKKEISDSLTLRILTPGEAMKYSIKELADWSQLVDELIIDGRVKRFERGTRNVFRDLIKNNDTIFVYTYNPE